MIERHPFEERNPMECSTKVRVLDKHLSFGLSLASYLEEGNLSVSPLNIMIALAMLYEGATRETAEQIAKVAKIDTTRLTRHEGFKQLTDALNPTNAAYTLKCANALWVDNGFPINSEFKGILEDCYKAQVYPADFQGNPRQEELRINQWVKERTEGKILKVFSEGSIDPLTGLILPNVLYFKASWRNRFNPKYTQEQDFTLSSGKVVSVNMMRKGEVESRRKLPKFQYHKNDIAQTLVLPYKGGKLFNVIILPDEGVSTKCLESYLKGGKAKAFGLNGETHETEFSRLELPVHELRTSCDLKEPLRRMGIERLFCDNAQLDKMYSESVVGPPLYVKSIKHQTYFKTNEEGSEGAAVTFPEVVALDGGGPLPAEFVVERPFIEAVVDKLGNVLFLNRVEDPR